MGPTEWILIKINLVTIIVKSSLLEIKVSAEDPVGHYSRNQSSHSLARYLGSFHIGMVTGLIS